MHLGEPRKVNLDLEIQLINFFSNFKLTNIYKCFSVIYSFNCEDLLTLVSWDHL